MLGRAVGCELPEEVAERLTPPLKNIETCGARFPPRLRCCACGTKSRRRRWMPSTHAFRDYIEEFGAVRREGLTRDMKSEAAERFFALGFALEQLREHMFEVHRVVGEWAHE